MKKLSCIFAVFLIFIAACKKEGNPADTVNNLPATGPDKPLEIVLETKVIKGYNEKSTPDEYDMVGYNRYYLKGQSNRKMPVLIIISGYVADSSWFNRMARDLVVKKNIEVWTINRREALIEDRAALGNDIKEYISTPGKRKRLIRKMNSTSNYLKGKDEYIKNWGFVVFMNDIKAVVESAKKYSSSIFLGGWSDGVEYCMIYSNFRFKTGFGSGDLKGMVFFDENPEWGYLSERKEELQKNIDRQVKLMEGGHIYMKYYPSLAVHTLALELAALLPDEASPLAGDFKLPEPLRSYGITNRGLIGWLYDRDVDGYSKGVRGAFAYLVRSGNLKVPADTVKNEDGADRAKVENKVKPEGKTVKDKNISKISDENISRWISYRESGEKTDISLLISEYKSAGRMWEYFYPRKVLLDYFELGLCDFDCPDYNVFKNMANRLPIYYILTGTNNVGNAIPSGLKWYMGRSGVTAENVVYNRLYDYAHADMFFAHDAPEKLYRPLHNWLIQMSGIEKYEKKLDGKK